MNTNDRPEDERKGELRIVCAKCGKDTYKLIRLEHECQWDDKRNEFVDCKLEKPHEGE